MSRRAASPTEVMAMFAPIELIQLARRAGHPGRRSSRSESFTGEFSDTTYTYRTPRRAAAVRGRAAAAIAAAAVARSALIPRAAAAALPGRRFAASSERRRSDAGPRTAIVTRS